MGLAFQEVQRPLWRCNQDPENSLENTAVMIDLLCGLPKNQCGSVQDGGCRVWGVECRTGRSLRNWWFGV